MAARLGPEQTSINALHCGHGLYPVIAFLAALGAGVNEVVSMLRLEAGELSETVAWVHDPDPEPSPPAGGTIIPDDDDDDSRVIPLNGYAGRKYLALVDEVPAPMAAGLAVMTPGVRGLVLFAAARGDTPDEIASQLQIDVQHVDTILTAGDGQHLTRP